MANEVESALKSAAQNISQYVKDAATMVVETRYVEISSNGASEPDPVSRPAARTVVRLDGDSESTVPMRRNAAGTLEVDAELFALHQQNVKTAIVYRSRMLSSLLSVLSRRKDGLG
jgi:hypothetical protein